MYDRILFPFDGSDGARRALDHAADLAAAVGATVQVLYVADTARDSVTTVGSEVVDALEREGVASVEEAERLLGGTGVDVETDVVQGDPAESIVDYADRYRTDLIVLPSRGRAGAGLTVLGSVTEKVNRLSPVPVLTVRMREDERLRFPYERVLVPTDGSEAAEGAADHAVALAATLGASVDALSVVDDAGLAAEVRSLVGDDRTDADARAAVRAVAERAAERGIEAGKSVDHGSPAEAIGRYVDAHDVDLVVLGATGSGGLDRLLLGSVAERVARSVPVPVLTVPVDER
ncbi:universal stress protein [Halobaculum lipolyticum]|uniref:Universal stress protein n=1 Tax=Halobaculum lipolyticum TaxID=3032001 RepID=A0ABD5W6V5_9EURY|nr:universal stress protein [Halobaculum sp. DT31]